MLVLHCGVPVGSHYSCPYRSRVHSLMASLLYKVISILSVVHRLLFSFVSCSVGCRSIIRSHLVISSPVSGSVMSAHCTIPRSAHCRMKVHALVAVLGCMQSSSHNLGPIALHVPPVFVFIGLVIVLSLSHCVATLLIPVRIFASSHASIGLSSFRWVMRCRGSHSIGATPLHPRRYACHPPAARTMQFVCVSNRFLIGTHSSLPSLHEKLSELRGLR